MTAATLQRAQDTPAATVELADEPGDRLGLAFDAYYQLVSMIDACKKLLEAERSEETIKYTAMLSRMECLCDIVFHAARLDGTDGSGWGDWDDLGKLRRVFEGRMP